MLKHIQDINRRHGRLSTQQAQPSSPPKWMPQQPRHYKALGEKLGINGDEIHIMLEHALATQDPTCLKLFERFLFAAKIVSAEPLAEYGAARKREHDSHLLALAKHERRMASIARQNARIKHTNSELMDQIRRRWKGLITFIATKADSIKSTKDFSIEESVVFDVLVECQLASLRPPRVDTVAALSLSFSEICNASSYMEQQLLGPPATWRHQDDGEEELDVYDLDWEDMEYWDTGEEVP